jgi:hypothetical protein
MIFIFFLNSLLEDCGLSNHPNNANSYSLFEHLYVSKVLLSLI